MTTTSQGLLRRLGESRREPVAFTFDGRPMTAQRGDTILTAVLTQARRLRVTEFNTQPRAGFCVMGACQDCWVATADGARLQACANFIEPGMQLMTLGARDPGGQA